MTGFVLMDNEDSAGIGIYGPFYFVFSLKLGYHLKEDCPFCLKEVLYSMI